MAAFRELAVGLNTPNLNNLGAKSPIVSGRHLNYSRFLETRARDRARSALRGVEAVLKGQSCGLPDQWRRREKRGAIYKPSLVTQSLVIRLMTSRSHAWAGWLSSRRSQTMAASIGLGERDSRWKTRG